MPACKIAAMLSILVVVLTGCGLSPAANRGGVDIRGTIVEKGAAGTQGQTDNVIGFLQIEGKLEADTQYDQAMVTVTNATRIVEQVDGAQRSVTFDTLQVGQTVEVQFTGPVMESYPVQATASEVVILQPTGLN